MICSWGFLLNKAVIIHSLYALPQNEKNAIFSSFGFWGQK